MFNRQTDISDYYSALSEDLRAKVLSESDATILGTNTDELVGYYLQQNTLKTISLDSDREISIDPRKQVRVIPAHEREEFYRHSGDLNFEFEEIILTIPIEINSDIQRLSQMGTSTHSLSWSPRDWRITNSEIILVIPVKGYQYNYSEDQDALAIKIEQHKNQVMQWIDWVNGDVNKGNLQLRSFLTQLIEERKTKITTDKSKWDALTKKINIPLKKTENESAKRISLDPKPLVQKLKPNPKLPEDYVLDKDKVLDVVSIIDNQGRQFEKTPNSYKAFGEEDLRNVILVSLNSVFQGSATGETFSASGKTDIYLHIDKGNILVAECKIWGGKQLYLETIDQLLGYVTWRHNFGIIITFVKQKNFTKVLQGLTEVIQNHPSSRGGVNKISETHLVSRHNLKQDEDKEIEIHQLFYNLYSE